MNDKNLSYFKGGLSISPAPSEAFITYINRFAGKRHNTKDVEVLKTRPRERENTFFGDFGPDGIYYVGSNAETLDYNKPGKGCPGLYCQWIIDETLQLVYDNSENFHHFEKWLNFLIEHFFEPMEYKLNGRIDFWIDEIESCDEWGDITVINNKVTVHYGPLEEDREEIIKADDLTILEEFALRFPELATDDIHKAINQRKNNN